MEVYLDFNLQVFMRRQEFKKAQQGGFCKNMKDIPVNLIPSSSNSSILPLESFVTIPSVQDSAIMTVKKADIEEMKRVNTDQWNLLSRSKTYLRTISYFSALIFVIKLR